MFNQIANHLYSDLIGYQPQKIGSKMFVPLSTIVFEDTGLYCWWNIKFHQVLMNQSGFFSTEISHKSVSDVLLWRTASDWIVLCNWLIRRFKRGSAHEFDKPGPAVSPGYTCCFKSPWMEFTLTNTSREPERSYTSDKGQLPREALADRMLRIK